MEVDEMLEQRRKTHGDFTEFAKVSQELKEFIRNSPNWSTLTLVQREVMEMVAHKIARILVGDPCFIDTYKDIAGYAQRALDELATLEGATDVTNTKRVLRNGKWETT